MDAVPAQMKVVAANFEVTYQLPRGMTAELYPAVEIMPKFLSFAWERSRTNGRKPDAEFTVKVTGETAFSMLIDTSFEWKAEHPNDIFGLPDWIRPYLDQAMQDYQRAHPHLTRP